MESNTNPKRSLYHLHIDLERVYEPAQKRNKTICYSMLDKENMRVNGQKHLDIWCDGKLYPKNPVTNAQPNFSNPSSLLRFVGDGYNGLLGYCNNLSSSAQVFKHLYESLYQEFSSLKSNHLHLLQDMEQKSKTLIDLQTKIRKIRSKKTKLGWRERKKVVNNIETLKIGSGGLKRRIRAVRYC